MNNPVAESVAKVIVYGEFGTGVLPRLAHEFFNDMRRECEISEQEAHRIATAFMADYGRMLASDAEVSYRVSKANKDGMVNMGIVAKSISKTNQTYSLRCARLMAYAVTMRKEKLVPRNFKFELPPTVED